MPTIFEIPNKLLVKPTVAVTETLAKYRTAVVPTDEKLFKKAYRIDGYIGSCPTPVVVKRNGRSFKVPCGNCPSCRSRIRNAWAKRCVDHARTQDFSHFVTLTYDPEHLPVYDFRTTMKGLGFPRPKKWITNGYDVKYNHAQPIKLPRYCFPYIDKTHFPAYIARLYKLIKCLYTISFFACSEYGGSFMRPHHHAEIFYKANPLEKIKAFLVQATRSQKRRSEIMAQTELTKQFLLDFVFKAPKMYLYDDHRHKTDKINPDYTQYLLDYDFILSMPDGVVDLHSTVFELWLLHIEKIAWTKGFYKVDSDIHNMEKNCRYIAKYIGKAHDSFPTYKFPFRSMFPEKTYSSRKNFIGMEECLRVYPFLLDRVTSFNPESFSYTVCNRKTGETFQCPQPYSYKTWIENHIFFMHRVRYIYQDTETKNGVKHLTEDEMKAKAVALASEWLDIKIENYSDLNKIAEITENVRSCNFVMTSKGMAFKLDYYAPRVFSSIENYNALKMTFTDMTLYETRVQIENVMRSYGKNALDYFKLKHAYLVYKNATMFQNYTNYYHS